MSDSCETPEPLVPHNLECILQLLNKQHSHQTILKSDVRLIYLFGSQLYGTASKNADSDVLIVVDHFSNANYKPPPADAVVKGINKHLLENPEDDVQNPFAALLEVYNEQNNMKILEAQVINTRLYIELVWQHYAVVLSSVLMTSNTHFIIFEDEQMRLFRTKYFSSYNLQIRKIMYTFAKEAEVNCFGKSKRLWKEDPHKSKKNIAHSMRYLLFGKQIVQYDQILDAKIANELFFQVCFHFLYNSHFMQIMSCEYETWEQYEQHFYPIHKKLKEELSLEAQTKMAQLIQITKDWEIIASGKKPLSCDIIHQYGVGQLARNFSIHAIPLLNLAPSGNLVKLTKDHELIRLSSPINKEIHRGLIVDLDSCTVTCWAYPRCSMFSVYEKLVSEFESQIPLIPPHLVEWDNIIVSKKVIGTLCLLYYYKGKWRVSHDEDEKEWISYLAREEFPTFSEQFWHSWDKFAYKLPEETDHCFFFEFATGTQQLHAHGVRDLTTFVQKDVTSFAMKYGWKIVDSISMQELMAPKLLDNCTAQECLRALVNYVNNPVILDPLAHSGVILCHKRHFTRYKILSGFYHYMHELRIWDTALTSGLLMQGVESNHNETCMLAMFCHAPYFFTSAMLHNQLFANFDLKIVERERPQFLSSYAKTKCQFQKLCELANQSYAQVIQDEAVVHDKKVFAKRLQAYFPLKKNYFLWVMRDLHMRNIHETMFPRFFNFEQSVQEAQNAFSAETKTIFNMFSVYKRWADRTSK